jgi:tetratricopeptide (TPR) repeat protein
MATSNLERETQSNVGWVGSLENVPLAEVFRRIAAEELSGDLQIHLGSGIKTVYFDHGFVVFAASNLKRDRLGESMIEAGRISRHEFAVASMLMKGSKRKFGEALVQAGVISEEELGREVAMQVNRIVLSLFKSKEGVYSFDERGTVIPVDLMVSLSIYRIVLEGIRHMSDGKLILAGLPPLNTTVRVAERPPFTVEPRKLKPIEQAILKSARAATPLGTLVQEVQQSERGLALRASYGLYAAGLLENAVEGKKRILKVQEETGVFVLSEIQRKFAKIQATNARQEILMEFDRLDRTPEQELLAVSNPGEEGVRAAYEKRRSAWEEKRSSVENERTLVAKIDVIQERLRKAYERMLSECLDDVEESGVEEHPKILETPTDQMLPPLNEELFDEIGIEGPAPERPGEEDAPSAPESRDEQVAAGKVSVGELVEEGVSVLSADEESAKIDGAAQEPAASKEKPGPQLFGAARVERVRQLLRDVKLHFQVRDWEHAVSLLYELVELDPDEANHHAMLARAMARHPVMRKDAERHFIEALRLAPQDADLHYSLGLYYKSFGMHSRAQHSFRTAIRINPNHEDAKKHISAGGKNAKDPLRDMFKKIFG